jgi:hypothetical protein
MEMCKLSLVVSAPGGHIGLQIRLDTQVIFESHNALNTHLVEYEFADSADSVHVLEIEMTGKRPSDTRLDPSGTKLIQIDEKKLIENLSKELANCEILLKDGKYNEMQRLLKNEIASRMYDLTQMSDKSITIENLAFDEIALGHLVTELATYTHNFNGSQDTIQDQFYGSMGCNGIVRIEFSSPVYLWMLENM